MKNDPLIIKKRGEDGNRIITVRIREDTLAELDRLAAESNRSRNELINIILAHGVKNVMLKLGGEGCFFKNKEERFFMDPYEVTPIDTTGCGDNFAASFIHGILKGMSHKECAEFACGAGGLNSQAIGAHMHIRSEEQIRDFMAKTAKRRIER